MCNLFYQSRLISYKLKINVTRYLSINKIIICTKIHINLHILLFNKHGIFIQYTKHFFYYYYCILDFIHKNSKIQCNIILYVVSSGLIHI